MALRHYPKEIEELMKIWEPYEDKVKDGDDVIMSVIGVGLLTSYMEDEKYEKTLDIDLQDLLDIYYFFINLIEFEPLGEDIFKI